MREQWQQLDQPDHRIGCRIAADFFNLGQARRRPFLLGEPMDNNTFYALLQAQVQIAKLIAKGNQ